MQTKTLSVVIPAFNEEKCIGNCLTAIMQAKGSIDLEILVINNASTDNTVQMAKQFDGVKVVDEPVKGLTAARQRGLLEARGELIAFVDADNTISKNWFTQIFEAFNDESIVCLSGPYYYTGVDTWQQFVVLWYWYCLGVPVYWVVGYMVVGGNFVAKKKSLEHAGGFDSSIDFYGEDTDIARRLARVGKVKFSLSFWINASPRRLHHEGFYKTGLRYLANYTSIVVGKRPLSKTHEDIR